MLSGTIDTASRCTRRRAIVVAIFGLFLRPVLTLSFSPPKAAPVRIQQRNFELKLNHEESHKQAVGPWSRRSFVGALVLITSTNPLEASAGIDPSSLKGYAVEGDQSGVQTRLRQIEMEKNRPADLVDEPFVELPSGVSYREFRQGKGDATVQDGSKVAAEMTIRCKSFATANEPGGLKYFATATDTDFNELAWTVGSGEMLPELESAMMGMRKGSLRRIEVPSTAVFAAKKANQLPLPSASNKDGNRRFENLFKTDATLLFEVLVTRIK